MGTAYSETPLSQIDGDVQWNNTNLNESVIGDLFAMASSESWVRVSPNPAQDNVNLSQHSARRTRINPSIRCSRKTSLRESNDFQQRP